MDNRLSEILIRGQDGSITRLRVSSMDRGGEGGACMRNKHIQNYVKGQHGKDEEASV